MRSISTSFRIFIFLTVFLLAACLPEPTVVPPTAVPTTVPTVVQTALPSPSPLSPTLPVIIGTPAPGLTPTRSDLYFPQIGHPPTPTPTLVRISLPVSMYNPEPPPDTVWVKIKNGEMFAPILVYHSVKNGEPNDRYTVKTGAFKEQMQALRSRGYTAITISTLADALRTNGTLPAKTVVITFDGGSLDIYQNAFPVMRSLGFPGVFYIISDDMGKENYVNVDQLKEMIAAGWEVGSHSKTFADITQPGANLNKELNESRIDLQVALGAPVVSFSYPNGEASQEVIDMTRKFGYTSAVSSGWTNQQSINWLYYLPRREIKSSTVIEDFLKLIAVPYSGVRRSGK